MQPNHKFITITDNKNQIINLISDLILQPRISALKWSQITRQTPNIKIGYPGQHLASLITGITGEGSGARGNDLIDGSEVKSCSRIDQQDLCKKCKAKITRFEVVCPECGSSEIKRNNDSKWLFTIRNENDLDTLLNKVPRILLLLSDYPNFYENDFETLRLQAFEIWPKDDRHSKFREILTNYYNKIYLEHKKSNTNIVPAPKNFWPESYQFYISNPIQVFGCTIKNSSTNPEITIDNYVDPTADRSSIKSISMPFEVLNTEEKVIAKEIMNNLGVSEVNEEVKQYLQLRDTDKISSSKSEYSRKNY